MFSYELRLNYSDETFEVSSVIASSLEEAIRVAESDPEVESVQVLCIVDQQPQVCLAW